MRALEVNMTVQEVENVNMSMSGEENVDMSTENVITAGSTDNYEDLRNLPRINGVLLKGDKSSEDLRFIVAKTTQEWASTPTAMSFLNTVYVYTDYKQVGGENVAGIKIGDGSTYVADLPFVTAEDARITQADIDKWNDMARVTVDEEHHRLVFY